MLGTSCHLSKMLTLFKLNFRIFSSFGERGKFIISGGNDKSVKVWDWSQSVEDRQTCVGTDVAFSISVQKKVRIPSSSSFIFEKLPSVQTISIAGKTQISWDLDSCFKIFPAVLSTTESYP